MGKIEEQFVQLRNSGIAEDRSDGPTCSAADGNKNKLPKILPLSTVEDVRMLEEWTANNEDHCKILVSSNEMWYIRV